MEIVKEEISFTSDHLILKGLLYYPLPKNEYFGILFIHGGGKYTSSRYLKWQAFLAQNGYSSLSFFCRGVGNSEGDFADSSLANRLKDSQQALAFFKNSGAVDPSGIALCGSSMGAPVAVRLLEQNKRIKAIIVQSAAAYAKEAENIPLNVQFTQTISVPNSWQNSPVWEILEIFRGNLGVFYGQEDKIIPEGIKQRYRQLIKQGEFWEIKNGQHKLLAPTNNLEEKAEQELFSRSLLFLSRSFV
ncbi:hypothetical protein A2313_02115 [Candidatus Roizmanbacteria bacterium RIFOXYB2_FULL_41_10]|uniref:Serine aminopeptidase S33 domain-containing protein n=1 Tax=Candidatus Roizmanbacteria bacterium RIFOXYA1_FULL_41_12 TaxID=1802082 RepID=A0A1F7KA72_9BACT|nr:MAG: hypothetical protein A2209_00360 [Candidatus Roizmanbacteria bacterium RIFOXYA1_FULL_41_12]OGK66932.1 MAG: hypothetical protein A2262_04430 [Candidatus Roizmanbacteria bacterium RIFOXYA2_FULL_41_8]OGK67580.1 MAG: hypothetical protein A2377_01915 [Candidatus Roizmanbacteria bacterium RIFOXYB1_FULL_41_27]OGK70985.1 MAG: hypothetical protein A2313_02115 [Candidatus Roizmanbacteria bacterium RIFOXYB2_FULL_41_10]OGK71160.1 MAG: hypothetical protein A2403_02720 [Candidatus Roizmanbacteria bac